ncbi:titin-like isoform X2 [Scleropages formosus]|uniref:titin-like isoform X2 n=1 Tax=Scleropages formosus TaxID=113540 RepID=UPI0010FA7502|nr:titin-like isoform X2 [Scleropages formosus]
MSEIRKMQEVSFVKEEASFEDAISFQKEMYESTELNYKDQELKSSEDITVSKEKSRKSDVIPQTTAPLQKTNEIVGKNLLLCYKEELASRKVDVLPQAMDDSQKVQQAPFFEYQKMHKALFLKDEPSPEVGIAVKKEVYETTKFSCEEKELKSTASVADSGERYLKSDKARSMASFEKSSEVDRKTLLLSKKKELISPTADVASLQAMKVSKKFKQTPVSETEERREVSFDKEQASPVATVPLKTDVCESTELSYKEKEVKSRDDYTDLRESSLKIEDIPESMATPEMADKVVRKMLPSEDEEVVSLKAGTAPFQAMKVSKKPKQAPVSEIQERQAVSFDKEQASPVATVPLAKDILDSTELSYKEKEMKSRDDYTDLRESSLKIEDIPESMATPEMADKVVRKKLPSEDEEVVSLKAGITPFQAMKVSKKPKQAPVSEIQERQAVSFDKEQASPVATVPLAKDILDSTELSYKEKEMKSRDDYTDLRESSLKIEDIPESMATPEMADKVVRKKLPSEDEEVVSLKAGITPFQAMKVSKKFKQTPVSETEERREVSFDKEQASPVATVPLKTDVCESTELSYKEKEVKSRDDYTDLRESSLKIEDIPESMATPDMADKVVRKMLPSEDEEVVSLKAGTAPFQAMKVSKKPKQAPVSEIQERQAVSFDKEQASPVATVPLAKDILDSTELSYKEKEMKSRDDYTDLRESSLKIEDIPESMATPEMADKVVRKKLPSEDEEVVSLKAGITPFQAMKVSKKFKQTPVSETEERREVSFDKEQASPVATVPLKTDVCESTELSYKEKEVKSRDDYTDLRESSLKIEDIPESMATPDMADKVVRKMLPSEDEEVVSLKAGTAPFQAMKVSKKPKQAPVSEIQERQAVSFDKEQASPVATVPLAKDILDSTELSYKEKEMKSRDDYTDLRESSLKIEDIPESMATPEMADKVVRKKLPSEDEEVVSLKAGITPFQAMKVSKKPKQAPVSEIQERQAVSFDKVQASPVATVPLAKDILDSTELSYKEKEVKSRDDYTDLRESSLKIEDIPESMATPEMADKVVRKMLPSEDEEVVSLKAGTAPFQGINIEFSQLINVWLDCIVAILLFADLFF